MIMLCPREEASRWMSSSTGWKIPMLILISKLDIHDWLSHRSDLQDWTASTSQIRKQVKVYIPAFSGVVLLTAALTTHRRPIYAVFKEDRTVIDNTVFIKQTLNLLSHSVDNDDCTLLESVFSLDAVANFTTPAGFVDGLPATTVFLQNVLTGTIYQHTLSTSTIRAASD